MTSHAVTIGFSTDDQPTEGPGCRLPRETLPLRSSKRVWA